MQLGEYGPFAEIIFIASTIVATFSTLLLKMLGRLNQWTWLVDDTPSFIVRAGAKAGAIALMVFVYITINISNYGWFLLSAAVCGMLSMMMIVKFDRLRKLHVMSVPIVDIDGNQLSDRKGKATSTNVIIGSESNMKQQAIIDLRQARQEYGGLSLVQFMKGYGSNKLNDPEALWDRELLALISNKLTMNLVFIVLLSVMTLFCATMVIVVVQQNS